MDELQSQIGSKDLDPSQDAEVNLAEDQEVDGGGIVSVNETGDQVGDRSNATKSRNICRTSTRKKVSSVWKYFNRIVVNGVLKGAQCKHCKVELTAGGNNGTSHLHKHAEKVCPGRHLTLTPSQTQLKMKTEGDESTLLELRSIEKEEEFNQEASRKDLVQMVIMHEYPLSIVDHFGFRKFVHGLSPSFKMISRTTLKRDIMRMYDEDKKTLKALLEHNESRVSVTTDMWTSSNQKKGYMVVTAHFIDQQWILRNRILRLHSSTVEALMCLQSWMTEDLKGTLESSHGCSTVSEDSDIEGDGEVIDMIDMDLDDELDDYIED